LNFEHYPKDVPWLVRKYYNYFFPKFARKAAHIITVSETSKQDIIQTYSMIPSKVSAVWNSASELYVPIDSKEKQKIRQTLTNGNSYFLFVGSLHPRKNLKRLLSAYLEYQKEGGTYDLVIVGTPMWKNDPEIAKNQNSSIHFMGYLGIERLTQVMGAASCLVYVPYFEGFGIPLVEAMKCGVPIIAGNCSVLPEVAGDAAIYVDPFLVEEITQKLHLIANQDDLREELSSKSLMRGKLFDWNKSAELCFDIILNVAK
jgi:glycosyltransferase involved in cell wall biosynthesis